MRCFLYVLAGLAIGHSSAQEKERSIYAVNKEALERAVKIYLAYEARNDIAPGVNADLDLPEKAQFKPSKKSHAEEWVYPVTLGLEIKLGENQSRVVVMAPRSCYGWYLIGTDDLQVKGYRAAQIQQIFDALEARRKKLAKSPLD